MKRSSRPKRQWPLLVVMLCIAVVSGVELDTTPPGTCDENGVCVSEDKAAELTGDEETTLLPPEALNEAEWSGTDAAEWGIEDELAAGSDEGRVDHEVGMDGSTLGGKGEQWDFEDMEGSESDGEDFGEDHQSAHQGSTQGVVEPGSGEGKGQGWADEHDASQVQPGQASHSEMFESIVPPASHPQEQQLKQQTEPVQPPLEGHGRSTRHIDVKGKPKIVYVGQVIDNLSKKLPPGLVDKTSGVLQRSKSKLVELFGPQLETVVQYGEQVLQPGQQWVQRCGQRQEPTEGGEMDTMNFCTLVNISSTILPPIFQGAKHASRKVNDWTIPAHLLWVEVDVDVYPVTSEDVGHIVLRQRPFYIVRVFDFISERVVRFLHSIPFFDALINARWDRFYWKDPACPLIPSDGIVVRAPLTPDGFCTVRPCMSQGTLRGQGDSPFCECDLPRGHCKLKAEPLRRFEVVVDGPLSEKTFNATCSTHIAWFTGERLPPSIREKVSGIIPRYLLFFVGGVLLASTAETLAELWVVHYLIGAFAGVFFIVVVAVLLLHSMIRTIRRLQAASGFATLVTSAAAFFLYQRFAKESFMDHAWYLLNLAWQDKRGRYIIIGSAVVGVVLTRYFKWFTEPEDEAAEKGWWRAAVNGQGTLRRLFRWSGLLLILNSCPNVDYGALVLILFLTWEYLMYGFSLVHFSINREQGVRQYLANAPPRGQFESAATTEQELNKLREHIAANRNQMPTYNFSTERELALNHFVETGRHVNPRPANEREGGKWWCTVM